MKIKLLNLVLLILAFVLTCAAIVWGSYFRTGLELAVNSVSSVEIIAPTDVENRVATERNRAEAEQRAQDMNAIMTVDPSVQVLVNNNIDSLLQKLIGIRSDYQDELAERQAAEAERLRLEEEERLREEQEALERQRQLEAEAQAALEVGEGGDGQAQPDEPQAETPVDLSLESEPPTTDPEPTPQPSSTPPIEEPWESLAKFNDLSVNFIEPERNFIVTCDDEILFQVFQNSKEIAGTALARGIEGQADGELDNRTLINLRDSFNNSTLGVEAANIGFQIVTEYLIPNMVVNEESTAREREKIAADYQRVTLLKGEIIVGRGTRVTDEAYDILGQLGMLDTGIANQIPTMAGVFVLIFLIFFACGMYLFVFNKAMASHRKETLLLFTLYLIELIALSLLGGFEYYVLPLLVFPMLVSILISVQASVVLTLGVTAVGYFIVEGSVDYLLFYFVAGIIIAILSRYTTERNKIFLVGFLIALLNFILSCAVAFIVEKAQALQMLNTILLNAAFNSLNGILTVIICIGTLPFWETFFGVVTPVKLLDLTNPTNPLLRRLTIEAPGTYHHALIVANLAETAAYDIGANPHTARAGGYYHDIGKLKYPQYFAENLAGENPHDHMDPWNSVQLIVSHVAYGLTLAAEYRLPQFIRDIIGEHHGTSLIQFFYVKAKEENPNVSEADFRYPYTIPQTRESACVMLADTVEAAVRAMIPHVKSVDEVEGKINSLIRHKLNDGQLADSQLSIRDVAVIEASFFRVLKGMYHERIPYPKIAEGDK